MLLFMLPFGCIVGQPGNDLRIGCRKGEKLGKSIESEFGNGWRRLQIEGKGKDRAARDFVSNPNGTTLSKNPLHDAFSLRLQLRFEHGTRLR